MFKIFRSLGLLCWWSTLALIHGQESDRILIIHGGAGNIGSGHGDAKKLVMIEAIRTGYKELFENDDAQGAVEQAIRIMEDSPAFNAGKGSVLTETGEVETDAIIINGTDLSTGAVGGVRHVKNPISLAILVKEHTEHVLMVGDQAEEFALNEGVSLVPTSSLIGRWNETFAQVDDDFRFELKSSDYDVGTVGAVAMNSKGQIFAGTSTGGRTGKMDGRVGDTPIVGAGTLADDFVGGISATGWGEGFIRYRTASRISDLIETGKNATVAINEALEGMLGRLGTTATGGAVAIAKGGDIGIGWTSNQMAWAYSRGYDIRYGVERGEELVLPLNPTETSSTTERASAGSACVINYLMLLLLCFLSLTFSVQVVEMI